jgi:hypothetical protein
MSVALAGEQSEQIVKRHVDPPTAGIGSAATLGDNHTDESVIVSGFGVRLGNPGRQCGGSAVFDFDDDALVVSAYPGNISAVFRSGLSSPIDSLVFELRG